MFDRLFGTFVSERDDVPCRYGLVKPLLSNNPLIIGFHEWAALLRDALAGALMARKADVRDRPARPAPGRAAELAVASTSPQVAILGAAE